MTIKTNQIISMTEANQNFSKAAKIADKLGSAIIFKNNRPKYLIIDFTNASFFDLSDEEKIDIASKRILDKYKKAYLELAK